MPTVASDIGRAYGRAGILAIVSMVIGVPLGLCGILGTLWILAASGFQPWAIFVVALLWVASLGSFFGIAFLSVRRRNRALDAVFTPLGLTGGPYMSFFRQYHGTVYGRQMDVYLRRGPVLEIEVRTDLQTRVGITQHQSDTSFFASLAGKTPLVLTAPEHAGLTVFALDDEWARSLLANQTASDAIRRLVALGTTTFTRQQVILAPGTLKAMFTGNKRMFGLDIPAEQVRVWVDDLVRLVQAAEALPAPTRTEALTPAEEFARRLRTRNPYLALWFALGSFVAIVVLGIVITVLVLLLTG